MYVYHYRYRSFDIHPKIISLAILGDERPQWRPNGYRYELAGCHVDFTFPTVKLLDYQQQWETLEQSSNPFSLLVMAHLKTHVTRGQAEEREAWKWNLVQLLYERDYTEEDIIRFFRLLDWMMTLPQVLQERFDTKLRQYQEERKMPILSNIERQALETGHQEGSLDMARSAILDVLTVRFNQVPDQVRDRLEPIRDLSRLRQLLQQATMTTTIEEFMAGMGD